MTEQLRRWTEDFGDAYAARNPLRDEQVHATARGYAQLLGHLPQQPADILEVGCGPGANLAALTRLTSARLAGVEPNASAREAAAAAVPQAQIKEGHAADIPYDDGAFDLVFTQAVLIHVPEDQLAAAFTELHRVARRWLLCVEYFADQPTSVQWRGTDDMLVKRDFGTLLLEAVPVKPVANGFFWRPTTGLDNLNWWLFERR